MSWFKKTSSGSLNSGPASPFFLIARINLLQAWRKLTSILRQSRLLGGVILAFVAGYMMIAFLFFHFAFRFVDKFPGLGTLLTERLLYLMFAFLFFLLLFSNLIIAYTNLFRNGETRYLLTLPIPFSTIFQWKFLEAVLLASWAFVFLVSPFLLAFGLKQRAGWDYYPSTLGMIGVFIILPGALGAWVAVNVARFMDRRLFQIFVIGAMLVLLVAGGLWLQPEYVSDESLEFRVLSVMDRLMAKTEFSRAPFLPSFWLSSGVLFWSEGAIHSAGFFILILLSYALFFGFLLMTRMGGIFYDGLSAVQGRSGIWGRRRWRLAQRASRPMSRAGPGILERVFSWMAWLGEDTRALIIKDMRLFWRDTSQWGQSLILFGLLGVYVINLRQFSQHLTNPFWLHLIAFMNLGACSLNLATLTTRFVYPQFSLEGKRLWIMGMAPLGMPKVVMTKFWLAACASLLITLSLVALSCYMLGMPVVRMAYFSLAITVMTFTLTGLAVGLGVLYPNFKEDNPGKIVSGFGGTFCLVLSFLYIVASVILLAIGSPRGIFDADTMWRATGFYSLFACLSLGLGGMPMWLGLRKVRTFEL